MRYFYFTLCYTILIIFSCSEKNEPTALSVHPEGWNDTKSAKFHGTAVVTSQLGPESCKSCHGKDYTGGESGVACGKCHASYPHPDGFSNDESENFHSSYIKTINWKITVCQSCHGTDYKGGRINVGCLSCHPGTPEGCTVCHGGVDNVSGAPPEDMDGNRLTTFRGVGAHTVHVSGGELSSGFSCEVCHKVPGSFNETGHVDSDLPAEVLFSGLAIEEDAGGVWNGTGCSGTYCHGGFELGVSGNSPKWTLVDGTQAVCGSCHGLPPGGEHPDTSQCNLCHDMVVDANNKINDLTKHINGIQELDIAWHDKVYFPIYSGKHMNKWHDDCAICHNVNGNKKEFTCFSCHTHNKDKLDAEHSDVSAYVYNSEACYSCHPDGTVPDDH